ISSHPYGILKGVVDGQAFIKGTWGAAIVDDLAPEEGDIVIEGKRRLDTFASTNLDFILRNKGITTIALGGFLTNCCVESTMRTGYEHGYRVITLNDCLAATSTEQHDNAISYDFPMFSQPMTSTDFINELTSACRVCPTFPDPDSLGRGRQKMSLPTATTSRCCERTRGGRPKTRLAISWTPCGPDWMCSMSGADPGPSPPTWRPGCRRERWWV